MTQRSLLQSRVVHMGILSVFILIALVEPLQEALPRWRGILAVAILFAWMLGQRYEREIIVNAGVADKEEVVQVERDRSSWFF